MIALYIAEVYVVSDEYEAKNLDELTIKRGDFIEVVAKSLTGFWKVKYAYPKKNFVLDV